MARSFDSLAGRPAGVSDRTREVALTGAAGLLLALVLLLTLRESDPAGRKPAQPRSRPVIERTPTPPTSSRTVQPAAKPAVAARQIAQRELEPRLAATVERAAAFAGEHAAHEGVVAAGPAGAGRLAFAGVREDEDLHALGGGAFHLLLMPVAGVGQHRVGPSPPPAARIACRVASSIGSRCPKSGASVMTSAGRTI
jgi:hypothetical protein